MRLVAVLANPALPDHGNRTRDRVKLAADIIGCQAITIVNLFPIASRSSVSITTLGNAASPWVEARSEMGEAVATADAVLFAYGVTSPAGTAGQHHRLQVAWIRALVADLSMMPWMVSGHPRHPSRWQRHTSRMFPEVTFSNALPMVLSQCPG